MVGIQKRTLLILAVSALLVSACSRRYRQPVQKADRLAWSQPTWGPEAEGLQCRLRPTKRSWPGDAAPTFKLDLRNRGQRLFAYAASEPVPLDRVSIDGRWYKWPASPTTAATMWPLAPGVEFTDLHIALPEQMQSRLTPGPHVIRVAFSFEGVAVVSGPVAIDIVASSQP